jgi:hypothetical protein
VVEIIAIAPMEVEIFLWELLQQGLDKKLQRTAGKRFKKNLETGTNLLEIFQYTYTYSKVK